MIPYGITFGGQIKGLIEDFNSKPEPDRTKAVINELSEVKNMTADNLEKTLDRDIKINVVLAKSSAMQGISVNFRKTVSYTNT